jgi:small multidrug resistance pump
MAIRPSRKGNMAYIYLTAAIITEVIGTLALKASDGFSKFQPSAIVVTGYAAAFFFLSLALRTMPVGIAYAIWAGSGTALIVLVGAILFRQTPDTDALIGIALILAGIVVINLGSSEMATHGG